jgi:hypothetical protein
MTANVSTYANTFACQNPGKIYFLCTWQTVMDNNLSAYALLAKYFGGFIYFVSHAIKISLKTQQH